MNCRHKNNEAPQLYRIYKANNGIKERCIKETFVVSVEFLAKMVSCDFILQIATVTSFNKVNKQN